MSAKAQATEKGGHVLSLDRMYRRSRNITVKVMVGGREADSFQCSDPEALPACLRPIYRHLDRFEGTVEFTGVEE